MSIRFRLTLWYTLILSLTLILFGVLLYFLLTTITSNQYKEILEKHAATVHQRIEVQLNLTTRGWDLDIQLDDIDTFMSKEIYLQVVNVTSISDMEVRVRRSTNAEKDNVVIPFTREIFNQANTAETFFTSSKIQEYPFLVYNKPLIWRGQLVGVLQAGVITGEYINDLGNVFVVSSLITILLASSLGWFMARKALKPIDHLIDETDRVEKGVDLDYRVIYKGPDDEIGQLTKKINVMLSKIQVAYIELEEAYRAQRRFVSDASHELRTPLTTIRGNVELIQKMWEEASKSDQVSEEMKKEISEEAIHDISDEAERMSRLVNDMLSLARADAGYEVQMERLEIKPLIEEVVRQAQFIPKHVEWRNGDISQLEGVYIKGNKDYLKQMLFIFIENAFKYTEEGYVQLDGFKLNDQAGIQIKDTGTGMDKEVIPFIFERFYRADISRGKISGTGLGLSIAKWIIEEHNGSVEVTTKVDEGTSFIIWLPIDITVIDQ